LNWVLLNGTAAVVSVETDGVVITYGLTKPGRASRFERLLPALLVQLQDMESGFSLGGSRWCIPHEQFVALDAAGIDAFECICQWSPLTLELESKRWLGAPDFAYRYRFYKGGVPAETERRGCFIAVGGSTVYRLDEDCFRLLEAIDQYNSESPEKREQRALLNFSQIKGLANSVGVRLDKYLKAERVMFPSKLGVDIIPESDGRISFVPKIEGVPQDGLTKTFFASDDIEDVYAIDDGGGRIRIVFDEGQQEVLKRIQRVRHIGGKEKFAIMRDPASVFDGVSGQVEFAFGPRVTGVGDFPFTARPYIDASTGIFDDRPDVPKLPREYGIECRYTDGTNERVRFPSRQELLNFRNKVEEARSKGIGSVDFQSKTINIDAEFIKGLDDLIEITEKSSALLPSPETKSAGRYVLIYTNESQLEFEDTIKEEENVYVSPDLPKSLIGNPKKHQIDGYEWLRKTYGSKRTGCLLADDMGLGKTLQVLMFLASIIESGNLSDASENPDIPPWNPILIVSPVILVENGTWQNDMQKFFSDEGSIFDPICVLHGANLKRYRNRDVSGRETNIGEPVLKLDELKKFKVILTNYETVVNYQHSFARLRWTAVVTDEAHEYKTPSTKISHALKALNTRFRIASTGTPVETQLFDVWNLFDFLEPGPLLGSASDFRKTYEPSVHDVNLPKLKERLKLGASDAHLMRRNKEDVLGELPLKHEHYLKSPLSSAQIDWHVNIMDRRSDNSRNSHPFSLLHDLMKVYQHPLLMPSFEPPSTAEEALQSCPKLHSVMDCLKEIRCKSEKALIFTRSINMQQLLALTLERVFGFKVYIVNGATGKDVRQGINNSRKSIVDGFRKSEGFNILILSPDVAGIGLTIVEANHVIHYGRWWNPAKESQATDRVYRIGQTKPVHVYYPIAVHPTGAFASFDEKLNALLLRRRRLASDFLAPKPGEDELQKELLSSLDVSEEPVPSGQIIDSSNLTALTWDRFEALVALIEEKRGCPSWLSPKSGDGGIDVVSQSGMQIRLVQCKHTQWTTAIDRDAITELIGSSDAFRASFNVSGFTFKPVLVTNATVSKGVIEYANNRDVEVVSSVNFDSYFGKISCSRAEVEDVERRRYRSLPRMKSELAEFLRKQ